MPNLPPDNDKMPVPRSGRGKGLHNLPTRLVDMEVLTDAEAEKLTPRMAKRFVQVWNQQPSLHDLAAVAQLGRSGRQWYQKASVALHSLFDDDAPRMAVLLAATSPRTSPRDNLYKALKIWVGYQKLLLTRAKKGQFALPSQEEITPDLISKWTGEGGFEPHDKAAAVALSTGNPMADLVLRGPKTDSFRLNVINPNMAGALARVTADVWHARIYNLDQKKDLVRWLPAYLSTVAKTRAVTKLLQQKYPEEAKYWTPPGTQAAQWVAVRTLSGLIGRSKLPKGVAVNPHPVNRFMGKEVTPEKAVKELTHDDTRGGSTFHTPLVSDPEVHRLLGQIWSPERLASAIDRVRKAVSKATDDPAERLSGPVLDKTLTPQERQAALNLSHIAAEHSGSFNGPHARSRFLSRKGLRRKLSLSVRLRLAAALSVRYNSTSAGRDKTMKVLKYARTETPAASPLAGPRGPRFDPVDQSYSSYSPNTEENLSFEDAYQKSQSSNQQQFRKITDHVLKQVGLKGKSYDAIGDWIDGAENSVMQELSESPDPDTLRYASAWYGLLGNQKAVLVFHAARDGPDSTYTIDVPETDVNKVRSQLTESGVPFRTIIPNKKGVRVVVYDEKRQWRDQVARFAGLHHAAIRESLGRGEFIGGATRSAARREYRRVIDSYERSHQRGASTPFSGPGPIRPVGSPAGHDYLRPAPSKHPQPAA